MTQLPVTQLPVTQLPVTVGRADGVLGELLLRQRRVDGLDVLELVSNGVLLMDSGDPVSERQLARAALETLAGTGWHVVVGGLGLGFTAAAVLADERVRRLTVVEIEPVLLDWVREGLVPPAAALLDDVRVEVVVGDVAAVLPRLACLDAVLLDVDNGPGFLVSPCNAPVYQPAFLAAAAARLRTGGVLAVWSADPSEPLAAALRDAVGACTEHRVVVRREGRELGYVLYVARRC